MDNLGEIAGKIPWTFARVEAGKTIVGMAIGYAIKKAAPTVTKFVSKECKGLIEDGNDVVKSFAKYVTPLSPSGKHSNSRRLKEDDHEHNKPPRPDRHRDPYPPSHRGPPSSRTRTSVSPLEGGRDTPPPPLRYLPAPPLRRQQTLPGPPPSTSGHATKNRDLQRVSRPAFRSRPSYVYDGQRHRGRPSLLQRQSTQAHAPVLLPVTEIYESLNIDPAILGLHVRRAESAKSWYANEHNDQRVYFLSRLAKLDKWMTSTESRILIVNGNDSTYQDGQPFSVFSWYINALGQWFVNTNRARPLRCFAGAHSDFDNNVNNAHTLMRSICWQMLDQYPIESIRPNPYAGEPVNTVEQFDRVQACWLFEELYYQFTLLNANTTNNGQLVILIGGANALEEGSSIEDFAEFLALLQRIIVWGCGGRRANVFKVLILFPGKPSELCKKLRGVVDVLRLPANMPKSLDLRR